MIKPNFQEFEKLCAGANLVPVCRECLADTETPVSVLARFAGDECVFLLESVEGGERFGRYSFIGINPHGLFSVENGKAFYADVAAGTRRELAFEKFPLDALRQIIGSVKPAELPGLPPLFAGAIGYLGYEIVNDFETLPAPKSAPRRPAGDFNDHGRNGHFRQHPAYAENRRLGAPGKFSDSPCRLRGRRRAHRPHRRKT